MISFLDLKAINNNYAVEIEKALNNVINSGWYVLGQEVEVFEKEFAKYCGANIVLGWQTDWTL